MNELECTEPDFLDCDNQCPGAWNAPEGDYRAYIDCTFSQYTCDDEGEYDFRPKDCSPALPENRE